MSARTNEILQEVLSLPVEERAELAESILSSLEPLDPGIQQLWAIEADNRVGAFERGEIEAGSADSVFENRSAEDT